MATCEKWSAQPVATSFDSGDIMSIVQGGDNKQLDYDILAVQLAKAWVNFDGTGTIAINDDFNVSSLTDNGVGDYDVNLTNNMNDANYIILGTVAGAPTAPRIVSIQSQTVSTVVIAVSTDAGAAADVAIVSIAIFGS